MQVQRLQPSSLQALVQLQDATIVTQYDTFMSLLQECQPGLLNVKKSRRALSEMKRLIDEGRAELCFHRDSNGCTSLHLVCRAPHLGNALALKIIRPKVHEGRASGCN